MSTLQSPGAPAPQAEPLRRRPANAVPRLPEWKERVIRGIAVVTLAYWTYYIIWRWGWTLNPDALWFSIPLVLAETWGLVTAFVMIHSVWRIRHRQPVPAPPGMRVDVYITCYDEPLEVIRRTAIGARAIRYPHKTYVLDDGERDEVESMARGLGLGYIRRTTHEHAKAGNLNNALKYTDGDFILQLDADHVPLPHILDRVLGFFVEDPRLGFVQTPQDFYNTDAFTYNVDEQSRRIWEEQRLFFGVIQAGKDSINSTFFCGCSAVIRRAALDSIGGFSTKTITEDIETSLVLHANGWNSAFYGESLVYGLAAHNAVAFHTQHLRWGQGGMQVFKKFNPITYPGLSLSQRISYFGSLTAYVGGLQKLVYYASPLIFFFSGILPIKALNAEFLARFLPFLALSMLLSEAWSRGRSNTWISERFHMVKFWTYTRAVFSIFSSKEQKFKVTPKGPGHVPFKTYSPQVILMGLTVLAVAWATAAYELGWIDYQVPGWRSVAFLSNLFWASINFAVALSVVRLSVQARQHRTDHRFRDRFPVTLALAGPGGKTRTRIALAEDLNPGGMAIRTPQALEAGRQLRLTLPLSTDTVSVTGKVLYSAPVAVSRKSKKRGAEQGEPLPVYRTGIAFDEMEINVRDQIELHCMQHAVPLEQSEYSISSPRFFERTVDWVRNARREKRRSVRMPATVYVGGKGRKRGRQRVGFLEEVSAGGARLIMDEPVAPHTTIQFQVPGTGVHGHGEVVFARAIETPIGVRFAVGVQRKRRMDFGNGKGVEEGMVTSKVIGRSGKAAVVGLALALAAPAGAQLQPVIYGASELDAEDLRLFLLGASVSSPGEGLGWTAGVSGYHLTYPSGADDTQSVTAIQPNVGVRYGTRTGAVAATVGYAFVSGDGADLGDSSRVVGAPGGGEDGVLTQVQANYWGDGTRSGQAIAVYNWGAEYLWTNFRGSQRVFQTGDATGVNLGAEAGFQGGGGGDYEAFQAGGLVEWQATPGLRLVGVVGGKADNRDESPSVFPYVKLEFVALPTLF